MAGRWSRGGGSTWPGTPVRSSRTSARSPTVTCSDGWRGRSTEARGSPRTCCCRAPTGGLRGSGGWPGVNGPCRLRVVAAAGAESGLQDGDRTALAEAWEHSTGPDAGLSATAEIRRRLLAAPGPGETAFLLDTADANRLRPLSAREAGRLKPAGRAQAHAWWRYLSGVPGGELVLPGPDTGRDAYEQLLIAACWDRARPGSPMRPTVQGGVRGPGPALPQGPGGCAVDAAGPPGGARHRTQRRHERAADRTWRGPH